MWSSAGDDQAAPVAGQHRLRLQPLQRLADRGARDAEAFGKLALHQPVAGLVHARLDRLQDQRIGVLLHRARLSCHASRPPRTLAPPAPRSTLANSRARRQLHRRHGRTAFPHVATWVFDLDNTLYPPEARLFDQIEVRMTDWVMQALGVDRAEADRLRGHYWQTYGTTLAGLMAEHGVDPGPYLTHVHDIDSRSLTPTRGLRAAIAALPGRKIVYTNGCAPYAERVLAARGLDGPVRCGLRRRTCGLSPQARGRGLRDGLRRGRPRPRPRRDVRGRPAQPRRALMRMGMRTVHVAPEAEPAPHIHHHTDDLAGFLAACE